MYLLPQIVSYSKMNVTPNINFLHGISRRVNERAVNNTVDEVVKKTSKLHMNVVNSHKSRCISL